MKTTIRFLDLDIYNSWHHMVEQHVDPWRYLTAVTATDVVMQRQHNSRAAIRVQVRLQVPGGSLHGEGTARTLRAALNEATRSLTRQVQDRQSQRTERRAMEHQLQLTTDPRPASSSLPRYRMTPPGAPGSTGTSRRSPPNRRRTGVSARNSTPRSGIKR